MLCARRADLLDEWKDQGVRFWVAMRHRTGDRGGEAEDGNLLRRRRWIDAVFLASFSFWFYS